MQMPEVASVWARRMNAQRRARGFTMVELLTTLVILAIVLAVAAPGMSSFVNSSRVRASQADFVSTLTLARSEAIRRGARITVGAVAPVEGAELSGGWRVFQDANANGQFDDGEAQMRYQSPLPGGQRFASSRALPIVFDARGFLDGLDSFTFTLCGHGGTGVGYEIRLLPIGLADVRGHTCTG